MYNEEHKIIYDLLEVMCAAINAGDWQVDGACDPDRIIHRACIYLINEELEEPYTAMQYAFNQNFLPSKKNTDV